MNSERASVLVLAETPAAKPRPGMQRRLIQTEHLMTAVMDFDNGPWPAPDPPHAHPHEQTSYVVEGDILFIAEGQQARRLGAGDMYAVPPNLPHAIQLLSARCRLVDSFTPIREDFLAP